LYPDAGDIQEPYEIVKASLEMVQHPDGHMEVEDLEAAFRIAGTKTSPAKGSTDA
jgi:hypothetical protein